MRYGTTSGDTKTAKAGHLIERLKALASQSGSETTIQLSADDTLFAQLYEEMKDLKRLREVETDFYLLGARMRHMLPADKGLLYEGLSRRSDRQGIIEPTKLPNRPIDVKLDDPYVIRASFQREWKYCSNLPENVSGGWEARPRRDLDTGEFDVMSLEERIATYANYEPKFWPKSIEFDMTISAQLLLYRLTVAFGIPLAAPIDTYKQSWETILQFTGGEEGYLVFGDFKGATSVQYSGGPKGSKEALKLLEWLVGNNIAIPYDYTLAGTFA